MSDYDIDITYTWEEMLQELNAIDFDQIPSFVALCSDVPKRERKEKIESAIRIKRSMIQVSYM